VDHVESGALNKYRLLSATSDGTQTSARTMDSW